MKSTLHNTLWKGLGASLLGIALAGCGSNNASDNTVTTPTNSTTTSTGSTSMNSTSSGTTVATGGATGASFTQAVATWTKIGVAKADLDKVIASKNLKTVHEAAFKVRDLVRTLPAQSSGLAPDKTKTLATQVKNVDQLAGKLDESGDAGNLKETQDNQAGLSDTLDTIKDLYPSGTFK
ncbi:hypothetical protein B1R32_12410 [Abditibacterium utsteinense]|uniref:Lipoprotein n=1 Tax=Abditibacterium utsteinense TaxID=1960156 RepID=A0A2S8SPJ0_9BACT|nr:hypothetical protein [Abditibacterium utsteinense]PQV62694.1 hypothetical protein B1R32_12410 [Abditibacterium utsteinense]